MLLPWMRSDESGEIRASLKAEWREEPGRFKNVWDRCGKQARMMSLRTSTGFFCRLRYPRTGIAGLDVGNSEI